MSSNSSSRSLLRRYLERMPKTCLVHEDEIRLRTPGAPVDASEEQLQLWLHSELADLPLYNEPITIHYAGSLDVGAFEKAFNEILRRHEAWRTSFEWRN